MRKHKCSICGYVYDEAVGLPEKGITPGTRWEDIPEDWACPLCRAPKSAFKALEDAAPVHNPVISDEAADDLKELSAAEVSAICSSLALGCEKQRLGAEMEAFNRLASYFKARAADEPGKTLDEAARMLDDDMAIRFPAANAVAGAAKDRGALRSMVWSEKVSMMCRALLERYAKEGDAMLENTRIWVCDICGFIYIDDTALEICPVCKVPSFKILEVERR